MTYESAKMDQPERVRKSAPGECMDSLRALTDRLSNTESELAGRLTGFLIPDHTAMDAKVSKAPHQIVNEQCDDYPPYFAEVRAVQQELEGILNRMQRLIFRIQL